MPGPAKLKLFVRNASYGPERYQPPLPQSTRPIGYWPVSARLAPRRSSNVMTWEEPVGVAVAVPVAIGVAVKALPGVLLGRGVAVAGLVGTLVAVAVLVGTL